MAWQHHILRGGDVVKNVQRACEQDVEVVAKNTGRLFFFALVICACDERFYLAFCTDAKTWMHKNPAHTCCVFQRDSLGLKEACFLEVLQASARIQRTIKRVLCTPGSFGLRLQTMIAPWHTASHFSSGGRFLDRYKIIYDIAWGTPIQRKTIKYPAVCFRSFLNLASLGSCLREQEI